MQTADFFDFFVSPNIKKQVSLQFPLNVLKLEVFQLQGALPPDLLTRAFVVCYPLIVFHYLMI